MERSTNKTHSRIVFLNVALWLLLLALLVLIVPVKFARAAGGISRIWAVDDGDNVKKTDNKSGSTSSADGCSSRRDCLFP